MQRPKDGNASVVLCQSNPVSSRHDPGVIHRGHAVLVTVGGSNQKWHKGGPFKLGANFGNHALLYQKLAGFHHLLAIEPDIEMAANAVDVRL